VLTDGLANKKVQVSGWLIGENRDTPYDGSGKTTNPLQERTRIRVWLVSADVRLGEMTGIQVTSTVPDVTRSAVVARASGPFQFSETFRGLGDTSVIGWRRFVTSSGWNMTVSGGLSLPTGKTEAPRFRDQDEGDSFVPLSRLQRGSGSVDPMVGVSINRIVAGIFPPGIRAFANAAARLPLAENQHGLRTGASVEAGIGASREIHFHTLVAIGRISWLHRNQDVFEGVPVLVGGGDWLYAAPALAWSIDQLTIQGELKFPLYRSLSNRQLDSSHQFQLGLVWTF
jgi:hypothetical protein